MNAKRALGRFRAPDEALAQERAWTVVRAVHAERAPVSERATYRRLVVLMATALSVGVIVLSPAGADMRRLIGHALGIERASPALSSLPSSGRLLVSGGDGTWTVAANGALRRLGRFSAASWSPHGRFVAIARGDQLATIDPHGTTQWTLTRPSVSDPRWYSPSGYRVAYLSAGALRVVAGDGTGDRLLAARVALVAPAWRPGYQYELAYLMRSGRLVAREADTGRTLWSTVVPASSTLLEWSADGRYLLVLSPTAARLYGGSGRLVSELAVAHALGGALSPDGHTLAVVLGGVGGVVLENLLAPRQAPRRILPGAGLRQVVWSPDGRWLLASWPAANQWVFDRVSGSPQIAAVSHIAQQFGTHGGFPQLDGWCCTHR